MGILTKAVYICDGSDRGYPCRKIKDGEVRFTPSGPPQFILPRGWFQQGEDVVCVDCVESSVMRKLMDTALPDPSKDPPIVAKTAEKVKQVMREEMAGKSDALEEVKEVLDTILEEESEPHFVGSPGGNGRVEVRIQKGYVELQWSHSVAEDGKYVSLSSLTLKRTEDYQLVDPPPFLEDTLVIWVEGCLNTFRSRGGVPMAKSNEMLDEHDAQMDELSTKH